MSLFDLEKHFAFYGAYHSNPINIFIHMLFVWPIFYTGLMLLYFVPMFFFPNFASFFTLVYAVFYVGMDKKAGFLAAFLCFLCWMGASAYASHLGYSLTWKVILNLFTCFLWFSLDYCWLIRLFIVAVSIKSQLGCWVLFLLINCIC